MIRRVGIGLMSMLTGSAVGQVCTPGDGDGDADVDFADFGLMQICVGAVQPGAECLAFDFDADASYTLADVGAYYDAVGGPDARVDYGPSPRADFEAEQLALEMGPIPAGAGCGRRAYPPASRCHPRL